MYLDLNGHTVTLTSELTISEGSDEVEDRQFQSVSWQKDGMSYSLYGFDTGLDAQTMLELASGLVE